MSIKKNNKKTASVIFQIQENWKWIATLLACATAGFYLGKYYSEMRLNAKIKELNTQIQLQIIESEVKHLELMKEYINDMKDLNNEIKKLQIKSYEHGKAEEN